MIILSLCILSVVGYMALSVYMTKGVPESLSATYYTLGRYGWVFQCVMVSVASLLLPVWLEVTEYGCMAFLACGGLAFVGMAPSFRLSLEGAVHYSSAVVCCAGAVMWQIAEGLWDLTVFFGYLALMLSIIWREKWCWWVECAVIGSLFGNLFRMMF